MNGQIRANQGKSSGIKTSLFPQIHGLSVSISTDAKLQQQEKKGTWPDIATQIFKRLILHPCTLPFSLLYYVIAGEEFREASQEKNVCHDRSV